MASGLKTGQKEKTNTQANIARKVSVFSSLVFFFWSNSLATELYVPTFRNTLWRSLSKRRHITFGSRGITQNKE